MRRKWKKTMAFALAFILVTALVKNDRIFVSAETSAESATDVSDPSGTGLEGKGDGTGESGGSGSEDGSDESGGSGSEDGSDEMGGSGSEDGSDEMGGSESEDGSDEMGGSQGYDGTDEMGGSDSEAGTDEGDGSGGTEGADGESDSQGSSEEAGENGDEENTPITHIEGCDETCTAEGCQCPCHQEELPTEEVPEEEPETATFTVSFEIGEDAEKAGVESPEDIVLEEGESLEELPDPEWADEDGNPLMELTGWYTDEGCTEAFQAGTAVVEDVILYAGWAPVAVNLALGSNISRADEMEESGNYIVAAKHFVGITKEQIPENFQINISGSGNSYSLTCHSDSLMEVSEDGLTYRWKIENAGVGTYSVSESGETIENYSLDTEGTGGKIEVEAADFEVVEAKYETSCGTQDWPVGIDGDKNFLFAASLTSKSGSMVISAKPLTASQKETIVNFIEQNYNGNWKMPVHFFNIEENEDGPYTVDGKELSYNSNEGMVHISKTSDWKHVATLTYSISEASNPDIEITNTYTPETRAVTIQKLVTGSLGDIAKKFSFRVSCDEEIGEGEGYVLSEDKKAAEFSLSNEETIVLNGIRPGATLTITETGADGYKMSLKVGDIELTDQSYTVPEDAQGDIVIVVTNDKGVTVDTGIDLDSFPYILILTVAAAGILLFAGRRRIRENG